MSNLIISLHPQALPVKPTKKREIAALSREIALCSGEVVFGDFVEAIERGQTFTPGLFERERKNEAWRGATTLAIDIDNNADGKVLSIQESLDLCQEYELSPALIYPSFSHTPTQPKYRIVWVLDQPLHHPEEFLAAMESMKRLFPLDRAAATLASMFYGTDKGVYHADERAKVSLAEIVSAAEAKILQDAARGNSSRDLARFRGRLPQRGDKCQMDATWTRSYNNLGTCPTSVHFSPESGSLAAPKAGSRPLELEELYSRCRLAREMKDGVYHPYHTRWGLMTNLIHCRGGEDLFLELVRSSCTSSYQVAKAELNCRDARARGYLPSRCESFCPHAEQSCLPTGNVLRTVRLYKGTIHRKAAPATISLSEAQELLDSTMDAVMASEDRDIHLIIADCGIGKTEALLSHENILIAAPTHRLKDEIAARARARGKSIITIPDLPDDLNEKERSRLERLYTLGATSQAHEYLLSLSKRVPSFRHYLDRIYSLATTRETTVTTHARALITPSKHNTLVFDEDPIWSLLPIGTTSVADVLVLSRAIPTGHFDEWTMDGFIDSIRKAPMSHLLKTPRPMLSDWKGVVRLLCDADQRTEYDGSVVGFLSSDWYIVNKDQRIMFIRRLTLPTDRKVVILSATAHPSLYRMMYGDRVRVHRLPHVELRGRIVQHTQHSLSRTTIRKDPSVLDDIKEQIGEMPTITFKECADRFSAVATFGALEGLDSISGALAIVGTPHLPAEVYRLITAAIGRDIPMSAGMYYAPVEDEHHRFWFMAFEGDSDLLDLQLWAVRSQLEQAIGRARLVRNDATVVVFTSYPVRGSEFVN